MALALRGIPALSLHPDGHIRRNSHTVACVARKCRRIPCIHCSAQNDDDSWASQNKGDSYAGWSFLDIGSNKKNNKFSGFLKVGAGIAVAVGFALVSHAASKKVFFVAPTAAVYQETSEPAACDDSTKFSEEIQDEEQVDNIDADNIDVGPVDHAEEESTTIPSATEPESTSSGQESISNDAVDKDVTSSAYDTGAASTLGHKNDDSGEELVQAEDIPQPAEDIPQPVEDITGEVLEVEQEFSPDIQKIEPSVSDTETPIVTDTESPTEIPVHFDDQPVHVEVSHIPAEDNLVLVDFEADIPDTSPLVEAVEVSWFVDILPQGQKEEPSPEVGASPGNADDLIAPEADVNLASTPTSVVSPSSESEFWHFTSVGIPAPSTPFAMISGRILVPPVVDQTQEQALSALQSLKVVEPGVEAGQICTRREYARWLVAANRTLARNSAAKVLPAMYIERTSELAFSDVSPDDPDFPSIQGLAEAGLIASKLSSNDDDIVEFSPDSSLSRQDLVSWKLALDHHGLRSIDHDKLLEKTGFIDLEQIHKDAWPSIAADVSTGDRSIIASAFGYTRRFQPQKPVTKGQAAIALVSGNASDLIFEELDRLEAERLAEKAVATEIAIEARMQKESSEVFREELELEKQMTAAAEQLAESLKQQLENLNAQIENEKLTMMKEKAAKDTVSQTKAELDTMMQEVSLERIKVVFERERLEKLLAEIEEERNTMAKIKSEMEVETKALSLARAWAEDEAKKARAHAKVLEEARKRWEAQGIEVHVDKELEDIPVPSWQFNGQKFELDNQKKAPAAPAAHRIIVKADELKDKSVHFVKEALHVSGEKLSNVQHKMVSSMREILGKVEEVRRNTFFVVTSKAGEFHKVASSKAGEMQKAASSMASGFSCLVSENTHKLADGCKGSAEKLAQIFKP